MIGRVMVGTLLKLSAEELFRFGQPNDTIFQLSQREEGFLVQHYVGGEGPVDGLPPRNY